MSDELNNMQDFAINEEKAPVIEEAYDPLDKLVEYDFSVDDEINLDESYEMLQILRRENKLAETLESENVIEELGEYIDAEYKEKLDKSMANLKSFIKKYNVEKPEIQAMSESEKTRLYAIGSFLSKNITNLINDLLFSITIERKEYKFLYTAIERKLSYDGNEVFNIIELNEKCLKEWKKIDKSLNKDVPSFVINIDIKNVVMLYHFLGKHVVKGLGEEFYIFATLLQKIADTNKLYNAYNVLKGRLDIEFNVWVGGMDPDQKIEQASLNEDEIENQQ